MRCGSRGDGSPGRRRAPGGCPGSGASGAPGPPSGSRARRPARRPCRRAGSRPAPAGFGPRACDRSCAVRSSSPFGRLPRVLRSSTTLSNLLIIRSFFGQNRTDSGFGRAGPARSGEVRPGPGPGSTAPYGWSKICTNSRGYNQTRGPRAPRATLGPDPTGNAGPRGQRRRGRRRGPARDRKDRAATGRDKRLSWITSWKNT